MPLKVTGDRPQLREVVEFEGGFTWIAHPEETMQRASHALTTSDGVWVVDPVDAKGLDDRLAAAGEVAGVAVLLDRHARDAEAVANRHGVAVHAPTWMTRVASKLDGPVEPLGHSVGPSRYAVERLIDVPIWQEAVLVDQGRTLVVPDAVGTAPHYLAGNERLGVSPPLRPFPPRKLTAWAPDRLLVGHGRPITEGATQAIADAVDGSRRRAPELFAKNVKNLILGG